MFRFLGLLDDLVDPRRDLFFFATIDGLWFVRNVMSFIKLSRRINFLRVTGGATALRTTVRLRPAIGRLEKGSESRFRGQVLYLLETIRKLHWDDLYLRVSRSPDRF